MEHSPPEEPREIGKFRILRLLGQGAMGRVYLAEDPLIDRRVAVKVMTVGDDAESRERFRNEARTVGQLSHPNIVQLYEFGFHQGQPFLAMEYLEGESLDRWLRRRQPVEIRIPVLVDLCRAVDHAHSRGVLHRDVKPANVQVLPDGTCKLMDFGIARSAAVRLTATGMVLGTPEFIAPEVLQDAGYSPASDIYAVALVIYQAFSGFNPFHAGTLEACITRVLTHVPQPLAELQPDLDGELSRVLEACLNRDPGQRPGDLKPVMAALEGMLAADRTILLSSTAGSESTATISTVVRPLPAAQPPPVASRWRRGAVAALVLAAAVAGVLIWRSGGGPDGGAVESLVAEAPANARITETPGAEPASAAAEDTETVADATAAASGTSGGDYGKSATRTAAAELGRPAAVGKRSAPPVAAAGSAPPPARRQPPPAAAEASIESEPPPIDDSAPAREPAMDLPAAEVPKTEVRTPDPPPENPPAAAEPAAIRRDLQAAEAEVEAEPPRPEILRLAPRLVRRGSAATLHLEGIGFGPRARAEARRGTRAVPGIRIRKQQIRGEGTLELSLFVDQTVPLGLYSLVVIDGDGNESDPANLEVGL